MICHLFNEVGRESVSERMRRFRVSRAAPVIIPPLVAGRRCNSGERQRPEALALVPYVPATTSLRLSSGWFSR